MLLGTKAAKNKDPWKECGSFRAKVSFFFGAFYMDIRVP